MKCGQIMVVASNEGQIKGQAMKRQMMIVAQSAQSIRCRPLQARADRYSPPVHPSTRAAAR